MAVATLLTEHPVGAAAAAQLRVFCTECVMPMGTASALAPADTLLKLCGDAKRLTLEALPASAFTYVPQASNAKGAANATTCVSQIISRAYDEAEHALSGILGQLQPDLAMLLHAARAILPALKASHAALEGHAFDVSTAAAQHARGRLEEAMSAHTHWLQTLDERHATASAPSPTSSLPNQQPAGPAAGSADRFCPYLWTEGFSMHLRKGAMQARQHAAACSAAAAGIYPASASTTETASSRVPSSREGVADASSSGRAAANVAGSTVDEPCISTNTAGEEAAITAHATAADGPVHTSGDPRLPDPQRRTCAQCGGAGRLKCAGCEQVR